MSSMACAALVCCAEGSGWVGRESGGVEENEWARAAYPG
jgi:hypothetical protein